MPGSEVVNQPLYHNQWKKLGIIGKGSYGQVYRALDINTGYIFAVKEVNSKIKRRTLVQALQVERETLKELEHPNIVRYLGFGDDEGVLNMYAMLSNTASVVGSMPFTKLSRICSGRNYPLLLKHTWEV